MKPLKEVQGDKPVRKRASLRESKKGDLGAAEVSSSVVVLARLWPAFLTALDAPLAAWGQAVMFIDLHPVSRAVEIGIAFDGERGNLPELIRGDVDDGSPPLVVDFGGFPGNRHQLASLRHDQVINNSVVVKHNVFDGADGRRTPL